MCQGLGPKKHNEISEIDRKLVLVVEVHRLGPVVLNVGHPVKLSRKPMPERTGEFRDRLRPVVRGGGPKVRAML